MTEYELQLVKVGLVMLIPLSGAVLLIWTELRRGNKEDEQ